jgi:lipid A 4'-phosphatase
MDAASSKQKPSLMRWADWCHPDRLESMLANLAFLGRRPPFWIPLVLLVLGTLLLRGTDIDLAVSGLFYDAPTGEWPFLEAQPWDWLYHWGVLPGIALGVVGVTVFLLSFSVSWLKEHRQPGLYLALALALGPGLIVNGLMKPWWGRPRPCQVMEFGGEASYRPPLELGHYFPGASFPSGHASIGFALMAPMFLAYRRHRHLAGAFFALGMIGGTIMGAARIVQGRHFLSDVMWSAAAVYFTCWLLGAIMQLYALPDTVGETQQKDLRVFRPEDSQNWQAEDQDRRQRRAA